jgi:predicted dehydrogenase
MRFGVLGTGRITRRLVADLQSTPGVEVSVIGSRDLARATWCGGQYGIAKAVAGYEQVINNAEVDAVYVALPPSLHAQWCLAAAAAGKHVLCEKPLAIDYAQAVSIDEGCRASGVRWLDATAWLHHQRTAAMRRWLVDGELGSLRHISAAVSFFEPFQDQDHRREAALGGGSLLDLGWYAAGCAIRASGVPRRVFAQTLLRGGVAFRTNAILWFDADVTATINCGYDTATRKWCEWAGDRASIVCDDFTRPWTERPPRLWIHDRAGTAVSHQFNGSQERNMIAALCSDDDLIDYQTQALRTQATLDAMIRSSESGTVETITCE